MINLSKISLLLLVGILSTTLVLSGCKSGTENKAQDPEKRASNIDGTTQKNDKVAKKTDYLFLNTTTLDDLKAKYKSKDPSIVPKVDKLKQTADDELKGGPYSVTYKKTTPKSGDKHDYISIGIYWWPDPSKSDGLPYIRKDGYVNPEVNNDTFDKASIGKMSSAVQNLALAYFYTGNEEYANYSAKLLKTWFLDPQTKMNPNMNFGQAVPGVNDGRAEGVIETEAFGRVFDAATLLYNNSTAFTKDDMEKLKAWAGDYLKWLMTNNIGKQEYNAKNNHGEWFDAQAVAYAIFSGQDDLAKTIINEKTKTRIAEQIKLDGTLPLEMDRTRSLHYPIYAMRAFMTVAILADKEGIDLWNYKSNQGIGIRLGLDYLTPYLDGSKEWDINQAVEENESSFTSFLRRAAVKYNDEKYLPAAAKLLKGDQLSSIDLMYPSPKISK